MCTGRRKLPDPVLTRLVCSRALLTSTCSHCSCSAIWTAWMSLIWSCQQRIPCSEPQPLVLQRCAQELAAGCVTHHKLHAGAAACAGRLYCAVLAACTSAGQGPSHSASDSAASPLKLGTLRTADDESSMWPRKFSSAGNQPPVRLLRGGGGSGPAKGPRSPSCWPPCAAQLPLRRVRLSVPEPCAQPLHEQLMRAVQPQAGVLVAFRTSSGGACLQHSLNMAPAALARAQQPIHS